MRYANTENEQKIEVEYSKQRGLCRVCNSIVIGHKGQFKIKHWQHYKRPDCDNWYEPITEWHLNWQNLFPPQCREVIMSYGGSKHRADIRLNNGLVIEIQNSPIKVSEIKEREKFYGKDNMIWIINGGTLATYSFLKSKLTKRKFQLDIGIPNLLTKVDEYDMDEYRNLILNTKMLKDLIEKSSKQNFSNGCDITLNFENDFNYQMIESDIEDLLKYEFIKKYGLQFRKQFEINFFTKYTCIKNNFYENELIKKHWRKFIEQFKFPVFIDNLTGVDSDKLYWYQKNTLVEKERFLKKYQNYCF